MVDANHKNNNHEQRQRDLAYLESRIDHQLIRKLVLRMQGIESAGEGSAHIEIHLHLKGARGEEHEGVLMLEARLDLDERFGPPRISAVNLVPVLTPTAQYQANHETTAAQRQHAEENPKE
jgi:hypothetical protein